MSCMSQNFRLLNVSTLSVRNFRIFLPMYPGSMSSEKQTGSGRACQVGRMALLRARHQHKRAALCRVPGRVRQPARQPAMTPARRSDQQKIQAQTQNPPCLTLWQCPKLWPGVWGHRRRAQDRAVSNPMTLLPSECKLPSLSTATDIYTSSATTVFFTVFFYVEDGLHACRSRSWYKSDDIKQTLVYEYSRTIRHMNVGVKSTSGQRLVFTSFIISESVHNGTRGQHKYHQRMTWFMNLRLCQCRIVCISRAWYNTTSWSGERTDTIGRRSPSTQRREWDRRTLCGRDRALMTRWPGGSHAQRCQRKPAIDWD